MSDELLLRRINEVRREIEKLKAETDKDGVTVHIGTREHEK